MKTHTFHMTKFCLNQFHTACCVSEILNPTLLTSEGPAMSWRLIQGVHPATPLSHRGEVVLSLDLSCELPVLF